MVNIHVFYALVLTAAIQANAAVINLGAADPFAVLAGSTVTNTGTTQINGDVGVAPGTAIVGLPSIHTGDAVALLAQSDLIAAYTVAANQPCPDGNNLTGQDLGGLTLTPGTYCFATSAQLTGALTLDALGDPDSEFIFQIGSTLTTASGSSVVFTGGRVFWQVGSSATLGSSTAFAGSILAYTSITLESTATIQCGRALAANGAVTMDSNQVSIDTGSPACSIANVGGSGTGTTTPEPATGALMAVSLVCGLLATRRQRGK